MRHRIALLTAGLLLIAAAPVQADSGLTDLAGHWARVQVESGVAAGYIAGYPDGTFRPDLTITRAEFFKLLSGALRHPPQKGFSEFADPGHWSLAEGYVQAAVHAGLIHPPDYGRTFEPDLPILRREMVLAGVRALGEQARVNEKNPVLTTPDGAGYAAWLRGWAAVALEEGIIGGYPDGSLGLNRTATRAEALVIVQRILGSATMELALEAEYSPGVVRHPAEREPNWSFQGAANLRPAISDGTFSYTFTEDVWGVTMLPAPGQSVWLGYTARGAGEGTVGVVARLSRGKLVEVARLDGRQGDLIDVDDGGRLWFSDGRAKLLVAETDGQVSTAADTGHRIYHGEMGPHGVFWAFGMVDVRSWRIYRVAPGGQVSTYAGEFAPGEFLQHLAVAEDGSLWLIIENADAVDGFVEARRFVDGQEVRRVPLLSKYMRRQDSAGVRVIGRSGPYLWVVRLEKVDPYTAMQAGTYKFDLTSAAFTPLVAPREIEKYEILAAPGSGILLQESGGAFWRVMP